MKLSGIGILLCALCFCCCSEKEKKPAANAKTQEVVKDTLKIYSYKVPDSIDCKEARRRYIDGDHGGSLAESNELMLIAKKCALKNHNAKFSQNKKSIVTAVYKDSNETKIFFGTIDLEDGQVAAEYSKAILRIVTGNALMNDPVTGLVVDKFADYSIEAYLEAAIKDDELIFLSPNAIPGNKLVGDVFREIGIDDDMNKLSYEFSKLTKGPIDKQVESLLSLVSTISFELVDGHVKVVEKALDDVGNLVEKSTELIPFISPPNNLGEFLNEPMKHVKVVEAVVQDAKKHIEENPVDVILPGTSTVAKALGIKL